MDLRAVQFSIDAMNHFVAILTLLSVIAHAAVGCCAHSVLVAASHVPAPVHVEHANSHSHRTDCEHPTSPGEHTPGDDHGCHHAKCQWLPSSHCVDVTVGSPFNNVSVVCDISVLQASIFLSHHLTSLAESPPGVPLRSHLALNILLI